MDPAEQNVAALVLGGFAGFARVEMVLACGADHELAGLGFSKALTGAFVGFNFRHEIILISSTKY